jgi:hypothetical protein
MQIGDLVKMRPAIADPKLYGVGLVVKVEGAPVNEQRCFIRWPTMPDRELKSCARYALELVSESR